MNELVLRQGDKLAAVGGFQRGKTTALDEVVVKPAPAALIFDPKGEWAARGYLATTLRDLPRVLASGERKVAVAIETSPAAEFEAWCRIARQLHGWHLVVDEFGMVAASASAGVFDKFPSWSAIWRTGHSFGQTLAFATHRYREVPVLMREVQHLLIFGARNRNDVEELRDAYGDEAADALRSVVPHGYLYVGPDEVPRLAPPVRRSVPRETRRLKRSTV